MTSKVTEGHRKWRDSVAHISLPIVVCCSKVSVLHRFQDRAYYHFWHPVTLTSLSVSLRQLLKLHSLRTFSDSCVNIGVSICAVFSKVRESERFKTAKLAFKVTQGHWHRCRSTGHTQFPIIFQCSSVTCTVCDVLSLISQNSNTLHITFWGVYHTYASTHHDQFAYHIWST